MKLKIYLPTRLFAAAACVVSCLFLIQTTLYAQDTAAVAKGTLAPAKVKPVKNTFESIWIIDEQSVMVPIKGTFEMDFQHRFGLVTNGYDDFWGLFGSSNIRIGAGYAPINNLFVGIGINKLGMAWDGSAKYAIIKQTPGKYPVSVTYYGDLSVDTRADPTHDIYTHTSDRIFSFNQIIIARKFNERLSLQVAPSISHQNSVKGYYTKNDSTGTTIFEEMKHNHFAIALSGRYKIGDATAILVSYNQPLTHHATNNPNPNLSFGFEFNTSGHSFQVFMGNYTLLNPAKNNLFNTNNPFPYTQADGTKVKGGQFVIGFNITRLWN